MSANRHPTDWRPDVRDGVVFGGLALVVAGVGWIYAPAALIVAGVALLRLGKVV